MTEHDQKPDEISAPVDGEGVAPLETVTTVPPARRSIIRRLGCGVALVVWFALVMTPCLLITLATQGQITVRTGELPEQELRIFLQMDADNRGLVVSNAAVKMQSDQRICLETTVNYLLWTGREEANIYCSCYIRDAVSQPWTSAETTIDACP
ncbi:MAG: hypothetical protein SGJ24_06545 [Chloroflexota bacterium]|nr:hypothetical protein [Chloroflexota bacterium]